MGHYNYRGWAANEVNYTFPLIEYYLADNTSALDDETLLLLYLTCRLQETLLARSRKGCSTSLATQSLRSTTSQNLPSAIFSMLSFSDCLGKVSFGSLEACSGKEIF